MKDIGIQIEGREGSARKINLVQIWTVKWGEMSRLDLIDLINSRCLRSNFLLYYLYSFFPKRTCIYHHSSIIYIIMLLWLLGSFWYTQPRYVPLRGFVIIHVYKNSYWVHREMKTAKSKICKYLFWLFPKKNCVVYNFMLNIIVKVSEVAWFFCIFKTTK